MSLTSKDPDKFLETKPFQLCRLISKPRTFLWYLGKYYDLRKDLGILNVSNVF